MAVRSCRVSCRDGQGTEHSVEVTAQSLYEAVAQAWRILAENEWSADSQRPSIFVVRVKEPETEHRVRIEDFERWLTSAPKSPAEMALKTRLRKLVAR